ncbi:hypothetical protein [Streptomyces griseosporeus]|uniref:hypothetical protein n=1 Tax=Streptomyces griseosporeus TaxID=1910 RepID=UPI003702FDDD
MAVEQLPGRVREFARWLDGLLICLDQGGGWCGVFWQRDPDGMRACLDGREVPPWDVVEALLTDFAGRYGGQAAAAETDRARPLHAAALTAYDARPGARDALADRLDVMLREQRYAAERQADLTHRLTSATGPEEARALRLDLAWARDDHARAAARCAELRGRIARLEGSRARTAGEGLRGWPGSAAAGFTPGEAGADPVGPEYGRTGASAVPEPRYDHPYRPAPIRVREDYPDRPAPIRVREDHPDRPAPTRVPEDHPDQTAPTRAPSASPAPVDPSASATVHTGRATDGPAPAAPAPKPRKRRRGSARFAGAVEDDGAPAVVPQVGGAETAVPPGPDGGPVPRGARFAGAAEGQARPAEAPDPGMDDEARQDVLDTVAQLGLLRTEGRSGEAHALLVEAAHWPAARFPLLAAELQRAGLGADWATLLWEAASLPADRLVAAADALAAAGLGADGEQMLRQGVVRPAAEIGEAVRALAAEGRDREIAALLDACVRVRTPEEAARSAAADPQLIAPLLLRAARAVSEERHWDLVHALRVAGTTG